MRLPIKFRFVSFRFVSFRLGSENVYVFYNVGVVIRFFISQLSTLNSQLSIKWDQREAREDRVMEKLRVKFECEHVSNQESVPGNTC